MYFGRSNPRKALGLNTPNTWDWRLSVVAIQRWKPRLAERFEWAAGLESERSMHLADRKYRACSEQGSLGSVCEPNTQSSARHSNWKPRQPARERANQLRRLFQSSKVRGHVLSDRNIVRLQHLRPTVLRLRPAELVPRQSNMPRGRRPFDIC